MNQCCSCSSSITGLAAVVRESGKPMSVEHIDFDPPRADEIRVRIVGTGICHTDLVFRDGFPVPLPIVLGHEGAGVVESVGPEVTRLEPGDHVVLSFNSCGACPNCERGLPSYCFKAGHYNYSGARPDDNSTALSRNGTLINANFFGQSSFASIAIARERNAIRVDRDLPLELLGPLGCGIQTGAGAVLNSLDVRAGTSLVVFGTGTVGMSAVMAAKVAQAGTIIAVEPNAARRALALELGATDAIDPSADDICLATMIRQVSGGGVAYALDTTGIPSVIEEAIDVLLPNGMLGLLGMSPTGATLSVNLMGLLMRGIGIKAILEGDSDPQRFIPRLIDLYREGNFPFDRLIKTFPFEQINEAAAATENGSVIKPVVVI